MSIVTNYETVHNKLNIPSCYKYERKREIINTTNTTSGKQWTRRGPRRGRNGGLGDEGGEKSLPRAINRCPRPALPRFVPKSLSNQIIPKQCSVKTSHDDFLLWWKSSYDSNLSSLDCVALFDLHWRSISVQPVLFAPPRRPQFGSGPFMPPTKQNLRGGKLLLHALFWLEVAVLDPTWITIDKHFLWKSSNKACKICFSKLANPFLPFLSFLRKLLIWAMNHQGKW